MKIKEFLSQLSGVRKTGKGWMAKCPAHEDDHASLSISEGDDGRILVKCFAGCTAKQITSAVGLSLKDLFNGRGVGCSFTPGIHLHTCTSHKQHAENTINLGVHAENTDLHTCTISAYAKAKKLPVQFLMGLCLSNVKLNTGQAIRIPYFDIEGNESATRYRVSLDGKNRFRWRTGSKPFLYGLWRLDCESDSVILVEGESDCHTLWFHGFNALGLPGATNWREDRDAQHFEPFGRIYVIHEPDKGGEAVFKWLARSSVKNKCFIVELGDFKDPSEIHIKHPEKFKEIFQNALDQASPFTQVEAEIRSEQAKEAWLKCQSLACEPKNILDRFADLLPSCGLAGETKAAKILYLALTSRRFNRPVSVVVAGPSAAGKSHLVETVLRFFPQEAYHDVTAMSERNLAYTEEPLEHRFLILYEAAGLSGDFSTYLIRSLLSEGRIRYEFVEKTKDGLRSRLIEKEGPTGLIMTTTAVWLHPENETRLLTLTVSDDKRQTANVLLALAEEKEEPDFEQWQALQVWLDCQEAGVTIPYARELARLTKPVAVRLRRDFAALLSLIKAHALLHMATRERDEKGRIVATLGDYEAVLDLVGEVIAEGVEVLVPESVKETVSVVRELVESSSEDPPYATVSQVKDKLNLDRSAALRRLKTAIRRGFVKELEPQKRGQEKKYTLGEPLPTEVGGIFPVPEELGEVCTYANGQKSPAHLNSQEYQTDSKRVCRCAGGIGEGKNNLPLPKEGNLFVI